MSELLPCPFCGKHASMNGFTSAYSVTCLSIGCYGFGSKYDYGVRDKAIAAWNTRATGWQPIETAPKVDSQNILLACAGKWVSEGYWFEFDKVWHTEWTRDKGGEGLTGVTHWMPFPPAPEATP